MSDHFETPCSINSKNLNTTSCIFE